MPEREISFEPPRGSEHLIKALPKHKSYNPVQHVLRLLKPAYGLRDAPKAWRTALDRCLKQHKLHQLPTDAGLYVGYCPKGNVNLVLSCHVDDLKIAAEASAYSALKVALETSFGKLTEKCAYKSALEHCGIIHRQLEDFTISLDQKHYAEQLNPAQIPAALVSTPEARLDPGLLGTYMSLLGGAAWMVQTRPDVCVYIQALQRATHVATVGHLQRLNKIVRYLRRRPSALYYPQFTTSSLKIICVSDSAFRVETSACLAMRGAVIGLCEDLPGKPGGVVHTLEYYSRRQRKVTRSTFAAETMSLADGIECSRVIAMTYTAIKYPHENMAQLIRREETGTGHLQLHGVVDCKSLFDHLASDELRVPSESSLILVLSGLKEQLASFNLRTLWWIMTGCMVADGLNKGLVSRRALREYAEFGRWEAKGEMRKHSETTHRPIASAAEMFSSPS